MKWATSTLGQLFEIARGGSPRPIKDFVTTAPDGVNWIRIGDAEKDGKYIWSTEQKIKPAGMRRSRFVKEGDFVLSNSMSFGRPYILKTSGCIHDGWLLLRPRAEGVDETFLYYALGSSVVVEQFERLAAGSVVRNLNAESVRSVSIPVPPLPEQQRIVGILDEAFAGIAAAKANAEKNLRNACELLEPAFGCILRKYPKEQLQKTTVEGVVGAAKGSMRTGPFGSQLLHGEFVDKGIAVLGIDNAVQNRFAWDQRRYITKEKYAELKRYTVRPGDVLITIMGTCGRCAIVPDDIPPAINSKHLCCITLDQSKCLPGYLHAYFLHHPAVRDFLTERATGSIMEGLNMGIIRELPLLLPPVAAQRKIVTTFDGVRAGAESMQRFYANKLAALDALKKSLLHQAFSGKLRASETSG